MGMANSAPSARDVGQRVSIRLRDGDGYRDILGTLHSLDSVLKKDGEIATFLPAEIAAWRIVEPLGEKAGTGAPLTMRINELEASLELTWPAEEIVIRGGWRYRMSSGFTYRANSIIPFGKLPLGEPELPLSQELDFAIAAFTQRGLTPTFHLPLPSYQELDDELEHRGWEKIIDAHIMIADKSDVPHPPLPDEYEFHISDEPTREWLGVQGDNVGEKIMRSYPAHYVSFTRGDEFIATGRMAEADGWAVLSRIFLKEQFRGQSLSRPLLGKMIELATSSKVALQVDIANSPAINLYSTSGFRAHHNYRYRSLKQ